MAQNSLGLSWKEADYFWTLGIPHFRWVWREGAVFDPVSHIWEYSKAGDDTDGEKEWQRKEEKTARS